MSIFQCCRSEEEDEVMYETRLVAIPPNDKMAFDDSLLSAMTEIKDTLNGRSDIDAAKIQRIIMDEIDTWEKLRPDQDDQMECDGMQTKHSPSKVFDNKGTTNHPSMIVVGTGIDDDDAMPTADCNSWSLDANCCYSGSVDLEFYKVGEYKDSELAYHCFRFTRTAIHNDKRSISLDLLAQLKIWKGEVLKIRPLLVFMNQSRSKSELELTRTVTISLSADVVWRDRNEGKLRKGAINIEIFYTKSVIDSELFYDALWKDEKQEGH